MARRSKRFKFAHALSLIVLIALPLFPETWFFLPTAVAILAFSKNQFLRWAPYFLFVLALLVLIHEGNVHLSELDILSLIILFLQGLAIPILRKLDRHHFVAIVAPLFFGMMVSIVLFISSRLTGLTPDFTTWAHKQLGSDLMPYMSDSGALPIEMADFYRRTVLPAIASGIFAWFGCLLALVFFVNGILENVVWTYNQGQRKSKKVNFWQSFGTWRAPDPILIFLVLGLGTLVLSKFTHGALSPAITIIGWHLTLAVLFPIFVQGMALAYYLIPRVSFIGIMVISLILLIKPIPVLVLAGLLDLWFDFRSKIRADPEI